MGHRNDDTIEDTRARKYSKIPTNPKPPKDQKNPADWRSLQRKSLFTSRILATQEHNTTAPKKLLCRIESCDRLRLESGLYKCSECVPSELEELTSSLETIDYKRARCITVHHGASPGRCCGASWCIIVHHGTQNVPSWSWHVSCVLCSFSTTAASYEPTLGVWAGVSTQI